MFSQKALQQLINYWSATGAVSSGAILGIATLAPKFRDALFLVDCIEAQYYSLYLRVKNIFNYDPEIYDGHYYQRRVMINQMRKLLHLYMDIKILRINIYIDDWDDNLGKIKIAEHKPIPTPVRIFLYAYSEAPHPSIELFPLKFITKIEQTQYQILRGVYMDEKIAQAVNFVPLAFSHHPNAVEPELSHVRCLCYVNYLAEQPHKNMDFMVFWIPNRAEDTADYMDKLGAHLNEITESILYKKHLKEYQYIYNVSSQAYNLEAALGVVLGEK